MKHFQGFRRVAPGASQAGLLLVGVALLYAGTAQGVTPNVTTASHTGAALELDLAKLSASETGLVAPLRSGGKAVLTIDPALQKATDDVFDKFHVPYGAAVMVSVADGNVLVMSGRSALDAKLGPEDLALKAWAPAASVFKVVSAAALVAEGGLTAQSKTCYHGGLARIDEDNLKDVPSLDKTCDTLAYAVGKSQNAIVAKMASRHLDALSMRRTAMAFGFGLPMPFVAPVETSALDVPRDKLEFARMSAGFFHTSLSPLHGALLAATIANEGLMPRPRLIQKAVDRHGNDLPAPGRRARRVIDPAVAKEVGAMMETTTRNGTAKSGFVDGRGRPLLPFGVAGKTGSLNYRGRPDDPQPPAGLADGELLYSWFVGYAPADKPEVAFAVLIGNSAKWRIKATFAAQQMLAAWSARRASPAAAGEDPMVAQK
ncbi:MAG: penicillin-binding transpeptidase domain-containing protein [Deltaproteobacteria bacterium]|nr:penicillin-binding transpeptidase domain-containing protein [Deltaproteobacteria bacterium]